MTRYSLESIIVILLILWLLGAFVAPFGGGLIHLLLVVILVVVLLRVLQGRRPLPWPRRTKLCSRRRGMICFSGPQLTGGRRPLRLVVRR